MLIIWEEKAETVIYCKNNIIDSFIYTEKLECQLLIIDHRLDIIQKKSILAWRLYEQQIV